MSNLLQRTESISNISIENFKAFGKRVDVPIRPITLIFGENSSGKSSILHSLLFLNQMQHQPQDKLADITYTKVGGNSVDLGGLPQLKYGQADNDRLSFTIEKSVIVKDEIKLISPPYRPQYSSITTAIRYLFTNTNELNRIDYSINNILFCSLLISQGTTQISSDQDTMINIDLDNFLALLDIDYFKNELIHFMTYSNMNSISNSKFFSYDSFINSVVDSLHPVRGKQLIIESALPFHKIDSSNIVTFLLSDTYTVSYFANNKIAYRFKDKNGLVHSHDTLPAVNTIERGLDDFLRAVCHSFQKNFREMIEIIHNITYIGPIRTIPTRNFDTLDSITRDPSNGSTTWEKLVSDAHTRIDVNAWLSKFGTNKEITTEQLVDSAQIRKLLATQITKEQILATIDTLSNRHMLRFYDPQKDIYLSHRDIGVGISQVLPVIVNCVANSNTTVLFEQPELHLHPRLQGDLADLFIETAIKGEQKNTYLIETHSEHIIRRIMRRIREDHHRSDGKPRITKKDVAILYVANGPNGSTVTQLRLDDEGDLIDEWPNGFFEEGFRDDMAGR